MKFPDDKNYPHLLQTHPKTGEPYIRLPTPLDNIILTPPRATDIDAIIAIMNDDRVAMQLAMPPYPFLHEHAVSWLETQTQANREAIEELEQGMKSFKEGFIVSKCPVQSIREVKEDGEEVYIGNVAVLRSNYFHLRDDEEAKLLGKENLERPMGDPGIIWFIGGYLASSHHGREIMSAVVKTMMDFVVPEMNICHIIVTVNVSNVASRRVYEKNGFTHIDTLENSKRQHESKGGRLYSSSVLEWRKLDSE